MRSRRQFACFAVFVAVLAATPAAAADKAINLSLFPPIALAQPEDAVTAFRYNFIYGKNTAVKVVDLGLVNHTTSGLSQGIQWGIVNFTEGEFSGVQLAGINYNKGTAKGLLWSGVNYAGNGGGLHIAFVNYAESMDGVQLGFLNIIKEGGMFPMMVIAKWGK